ncbi:FecCD family ABC transporter permease [Marinobacterium sp. YM272]|uniref:FecCD family ABC transporter permease n=1 Tax=Marinobacterium sp. YM272 TaxID=3421654 RepID=UPI003D7F98A3
MNTVSPPASTLFTPPGYWLLTGRLGTRSVSLLIPQRATLVNAVLLLLILVAATASLSLGELPLSPSEVWQAIRGEGPALQQLVVQQLRLQRVLAGVATGAAFALSGCLMQTLSRNRLATPGIIGIDNAATAFAVASVLGTGLALTPPAMSLVGAATATALAFGLSGDSGRRGYRFIIAGVAIGAVAGALTQFMLSRVAIDDANAAFPWTVGSLNARNSEATLLLGLALLPCLLLALRWASALKLVQVSDAVSLGLGVNLKQVRRNGLMLSVLLTGLAVAVAGPVGLVALIGPELARTLCKHRGVPLLAATLCGALIMLLADLVGRLMLSPLEIPVGIVTAVVGSPYLLWMLLNPSFRSQP